MSDEKQLDQKQRLLAIREHLRVKARVDSPGFPQEVADACVDAVKPIILRNSTQQGEKIVAAIAVNLGVRFEEVQSHDDIKRLEQKYLPQLELGFGLIEKELSSDEVDALLIQREHADPHAHDRWVAVLNVQKSRSRAYWSRPHELVHRIAEPPQKRLRFYRHKNDYENALEKIIDLGAAGLAFPDIAFAPVVGRFSGEDLTWSLIERIRLTFAPTASLLSVAKATLRFWPRPATLLIAQMARKKSDPHAPAKLRIKTEGFSEVPGGVFFIPNMHVPQSSVVMHAFVNRTLEADYENLSSWQTTDGKQLPDRLAFISAQGLSDKVYVLVSPR